MADNGWQSFQVSHKDVSLDLLELEVKRRLEFSLRLEQQSLCHWIINCLLIEDENLRKKSRSGYLRRWRETEIKIVQILTLLDYYYCFHHGNSLKKSSVKNSFIFILIWMILILFFIIIGKKINCSKKLLNYYLFRLIFNSFSRPTEQFNQILF